MFVIVYPPHMEFEIKGQKVVVLLSQEMVDLAQALAVNPDLIDRIDTETMTIVEKQGGAR